MSQDILFIYKVAQFFEHIISMTNFAKNEEKQMFLLTQGQHLPILNSAVILSKIGARKLKIKLPLRVKRAFWKKNAQSSRSAACRQYRLSNAQSLIEKPLSSRYRVENDLIGGTWRPAHALLLPYCRCCHCETIVAEMQLIFNSYRNFRVRKRRRNCSSPFLFFLRSTRN